MANGKKKRKSASSYAVLLQMRHESARKLIFLWLKSMQFMELIKIYKPPMV